jgi:hypothetical protein
LDGTDMASYITVSTFVLAAVGVLLISYVQTGIIRAEGFKTFREKGFVTVYWRDRSAIERWCFFVGVALLVMPFVAFGVIAMANAGAV